MRGVCPVTVRDRREARHRSAGQAAGCLVCASRSCEYRSTSSSPHALKTTMNSRNILLVSYDLRAGARAAVLTNTGPLCDAATIAFVISPVVMSGYRSRPRWLMALADCDAAEMLGAFDAGIG
jgi:hypothetical protein